MEEVLVLSLNWKCPGWNPSSHNPYFFLTFIVLENDLQNFPSWAWFWSSYVYQLSSLLLSLVPISNEPNTPPPNSTNEVVFERLLPLSRLTTSLLSCSLQTQLFWIGWLRKVLRSKMQCHVSDHIHLCTGRECWNRESAPAGIYSQLPLVYEIHFIQAYWEKMSPTLQEHRLADRCKIQMIPILLPQDEMTAISTPIAPCGAGHW